MKSRRPYWLVFTNDEVIHRCIEAWLVLNNVRCKMHVFTAEVIHEGYLDVTYLVRDEGAIRCTPQLWDITFEAPFFMKRRSPLKPESSRTLIVLS